MQRQVDFIKLKECLKELPLAERGEYITRSVANILNECPDGNWPLWVSAPKGKGRAKKTASGYTVEFERFWAAYPSAPSRGKPGKGSAFKSWEHIKMDKVELCALCLKALDWQKLTEQWTKSGGEFIPHPTTYLNQRRWEDEPPESVHPNGVPPSPTGRRMVM